MEAFAFDFVHRGEESGKELVVFHLPLIQDWSYEFDYNAGFLFIPFGGHMKIGL